jgi:hypothetical protein
MSRACIHHRRRLELSPNVRESSDIWNSCRDDQSGRARVPILRNTTSAPDGFSYVIEVAILPVTILAYVNGHFAELIEGN